MTREQLMKSMTKDLNKFVAKYGRRGTRVVDPDPVTIEYKKPTRSEWDAMPEWDRQYHNICPNVEYIMVYETVNGEKSLLYAINVDADSLITAAAELMDLASRKCL